MSSIRHLGRVLIQIKLHPKTAKRIANAANEAVGEIKALTIDTRKGPFPSKEGIEAFIRQNKAEILQLTERVTKNPASIEGKNIIQVLKESFGPNAQKIEASISQQYGPQIQKYIAIFENHLNKNFEGKSIPKSVAKFLTALKQNPVKTAAKSYEDFFDGPGGAGKSIGIRDLRQRSHDPEHGPIDCASRRSRDRR